MTVYANVFNQESCVASAESAEEAIRLRGESDFIMWVDLVEPEEKELDNIADAFDIPDLAKRTTSVPIARPRFDRHGDRVWCTFPVAHYVEKQEIIERYQVHLHINSRTIISIREVDKPERNHICSVLQHNRRAETTLTVALTLIGEAVKHYVPVLQGLEVDINQIEDEVFSSHEGVTRRAYDLSRQIIEFQRAVSPLASLVDDLCTEVPDTEAGQHEHALARETIHRLEDVDRRIDSYRALMQNILNVNLALTGLRQNETMRDLTESSLKQDDQMKRVSSWAAILFAPTLVGTVYGMNFTHMPELKWTIGYPLALLAMFAVSLVMYVVFKRKGWID